MELAIILNENESCILENGQTGNADYDNLVLRLRKLIDTLNPDKTH